MSAANGAASENGTLKEAFSPGLKTLMLGSVFGLAAAGFLAPAMTLTPALI